MAPFVPPPAEEAPYRALPPHVFPLRVKLRTCFTIYLTYQILGVSMGVLAPIMGFLVKPTDFLHNFRYREFLLLMVVGGVVIGGCLGLVLALARYVKMEIVLRQQGPPM